MKIRRSTSHAPAKVEIQMTPMIDIVFQLLVFFVMSFKIGALEGDFNIKMPLASQAGQPDMSLIPPMKLYLTADSRGELQLPFVLNDRQFDSFAALTAYLAELLTDERGPGSVQETAEVELHCDFNLRYEYTVQAINAVSGMIDPQTGTVVKLIEKIKFAPQTS